MNICIICGKFHNNSKYCSHQCRIKGISGDNSPMKRPEVRAKVSEENSCNKRPEKREKSRR